MNTNIVDTFPRFCVDTCLVYCLGLLDDILLLDTDVSDLRPQWILTYTVPLVHE